MPLPPPPPPTGKRDMKVVALAVVCIVLAASLISVFAIYQPTSTQSQINSKNKEISSLQAKIANLNSEYNSNATGYENQIQSLNAQLTNLTTELNSEETQMATALNIMTLNASETLLGTTTQTVNGSTDAFDHSLPYPGYVVVQATSNSTTTFAQASYSAYGVIYNETITLGKSGTATFPILPATVNIKLGNTQTAAFNITVSITYHY